MGDQGKACVYGLGAVLLWSTVAAAFKLTLRHIDPLQLLLYASTTALLLLGGILTLRGKLGLAFGCTVRQYLRSFGLGLLNPFCYYLILFKAYDLLPAQVAQPLNYTWALTLAVLSIPLLGQKIGARDFTAGIVCYAGVLVISTGGDFAGFRIANPLGVGLALGSTVIWALYWIENTRDDRDPVAGLFLNFLFGLPFILIACLLFSDPRIPSMKGLLGAIYVGVIEMGAAFVLWLTALKLSENTARVGFLIFLSPFLSLIFIHFLVGEEILPSTLIGLVLIVAGLLVQQIRRNQLDKGDRTCKKPPMTATEEPTCSQTST